LTKVKVCGITNLADARMCIEAGVDLLGFVTEFPVSVPWNLKRDQSLAIMDQVRGRIGTVVVTSGPVETILEIARLTRPDFVQLHGREALKEIAALVEKLAEIPAGVIKALSVEQETGEAYFEIKDPKQAALAIQAAGVWGITVDSKTRSMPAGTGKTMDWALAAEINQMLTIPMLLAGGLKAENAGLAVAQVKPYGLDVISGVEKAYGQKDPKQVKLFVRRVKETTI
jgi:phosphoribosylanthranilate isomerase